MSSRSTPDREKTGHPKRYGKTSKARRVNPARKAEADAFLLRSFTTWTLKKGGKSKKVSKASQAAILFALLHRRGWDPKGGSSGRGAPSRACMVSLATLAKEVEITWKTAAAAIEALEAQKIIKGIPGGWEITTKEAFKEIPEIGTESTVTEPVGTESIGTESIVKGGSIGTESTDGSLNLSFSSPPASSIERRRVTSGPSSADSSSLRSSSSAPSAPPATGDAAAAKPGEGGRGAPPAAAAVTTRGKGEKNEKNERRELLDELIGKSNHSWHEGDGWSGSIFGILLEGKKRNTIRILYWWNQGGACSVGVDRYGVWLPLGVIKEETRNIRKYLGDSWGMEDTLVAWEKELFKKFGKRGKEGKMKEEEREKIMSNPPGWFRKVVARDYKEETREWTWDVLGFVPPGDAWVGRYLKDVEGEDGSPDEGDRGVVSPVEEEEEEDHLSPDGEDEEGEDGPPAWEEEDEESGDISPAWEDMEGDSWDLLGEDMEGDAAWDLEEQEPHPSPDGERPSGRHDLAALSLPWGSPGDLPPDLH